MTAIAIVPELQDHLPAWEPDRFFTADQQERLSTLMSAWREARDREIPFPAEEGAALERLIEEELEASTLRAIEIRKRITRSRASNDGCESQTVSE